MKLMKNIIFLFIALLTFSSCEKLLMDGKPKTDALSIFDEYATLVTEKYAMLEVKGVDIDMLSDSIRETIQEGISETDLFNKLGIITKRLRDGHSVLIQDASAENALNAGHDFIEGYPVGLDINILVNNYVDKTLNPQINVLDGGAFGIRAVWGTLIQDNEIGDIWIPSWNEEISDDEIETMFSDLKDTKGLILDMRFNTGGDPSLATKFASYFTDKAVPHTALIGNADITRQ